MLSYSFPCVAAFWLILKQQWTIEEISIFSNSSHLEQRTVGTKVTTLDNDLARNISANYGSNPSSGSWEEVCFTYFP
jgi:hypothetical protein